VGGYVAMAIGFVILGFILNHQVNQLDQTQDEIQTTQRMALMTQKTIKQIQKAAATTAIHNAGAICLGLTAKTKEDEIRIVEAFLASGETITAQFTPQCRAAAHKAAEDIFGPSGIPPELHKELGG
jgi:predicted lactoylglutathione lyase